MGSAQAFDAQPLPTWEPMGLAQACVAAATATVAIAILPVWLTLVGLLMLLMTIAVAPKLIGARFDVFEIFNVIVGGYFLQFVGEVFGVELRLNPRLPFWMSKDHFDRLLPAILVVAMAGFCCFCIGYYSSLPVAVAKKLPRLSPRWNPRRVKPVIAVYMAVGLAAWLVLIQQSGGIAQYLFSLPDSNHLLEGKYYLVLASSYFPIYAVVICRAWGREMGLARYEAGSYILFLLAALPAVTEGQRGSVIWLLLCLMAAGHYIPSKVCRARRYVAAIPALACLVLLPALLVIAADLKFGVLPFEMVQDFMVSPAAEAQALGSSSLGLLKTAEGMMLRNYGAESLGLILERTGRVTPPQMGHTLIADPLATFIPRAIWPRKPLSVGLRVEDIFLDHQGGYAAALATAEGELYWNFFYPGVIVGMLLFGMLCKTGYAHFRENRNVSGLLAYIASFGAAITVQASPSTTLPTFAFYLGVGLAAYWVLTGGARDSSAWNNRLRRTVTGHIAGGPTF